MLHSEEKRKILHFITGLELGGGAENMLSKLLPKMQAKLENRVCVIMGRGELGRRLEARGIRIYYLDLKNIFDLGMVWRYRKVLKDFQPDIQVNYLIHADIFGRIFGKLFGVKKIVSYIRGVHMVKTRKLFFLLEKLTLPLSYFILTNSETTKKFYLQKLGIKEGKIKCIPNAVAYQDFENIPIDKNQKRRELGLPPQKIILGTISRLDKIKDLPTIIEASSQVLTKNPDIHLLIVGSGKEKENIVALIRKMHLEDQVTFLEKRTDIEELLAIMDIFILASKSEGMSNALLAAMAARKTIITSDIEENQELIKNGINGLNFRTGNAKDLAEKIFFCLNKNDEVTKFKNAAHLSIQDKYTFPIITKSYTEFLSNL